MTSRRVRLDTLADVQLGRQRSPKNHEGPQMRPYLRAANVGRNGLRLDDVKEMNFSDQEMITFRLAAGDILVGEASGSALEVGKSAIWENEIENCAFQNTLIRVRPRAAMPRYLLHFLRSQSDSGAFAEISRGAGIYHLGRKALAELEVPLPPETVQARISDVLDRVDAVRAKRRRSLALLDDLSRAIFVETFVESSNNWEMSSLGEVCEGFHYGTSVKSSTEGYPTLRIPNVIGGGLDLGQLKRVPVEKKEFERLRLRDGDLLFVRTNGNPEYVGRCAVFSEGAVSQAGLPVDEFIYASYLIRARLDLGAVTPRYVAEFMGSGIGRSALLMNSKTSAGQFNINTQGLKSIRLPIPPIDIQQAFGEKIETLKHAKRHHEIHLGQLDSLFGSLQFLAFQGNYFAGAVSAQ